MVPPLKSIAKQGSKQIGQAVTPGSKIQNILPYQIYNIYIIFLS
jgi:hypothetical protein